MPIAIQSLAYLAKLTLPSLADLAVFRLGELGGESTVTSVIGSGFSVLDRELAGRGWPRGNLTEILCDGVGMGELALLLPAIRHAQRDESAAGLNHAGSGTCVWVTAPHLPYAPALRDAGIDLTRLFVIDAIRTEDSLWAAEQALASGAVACVCVWISGAISNTSLRRLKHAAMSGGAICWLMRTTLFARHASPASLRIMLTAERNGELVLNLIKRRGLPSNKTIRLCARSLPSLGRRVGEQQRQRHVQDALARSHPAATSTPLREWLGRAFGQAVPHVSAQVIPIRSRALAPDR